MRCSSTPNTAPPKTQANTMAATASALILGPSARGRCGLRQQSSCDDAPRAAEQRSGQERRLQQPTGGRSQGKIVAAVADTAGRPDRQGLVVDVATPVIDGLFGGAETAKKASNQEVVMRSNARTCLAAIGAVLALGGCGSG